jgi:hypothetical protein
LKILASEAQKVAIVNQETLIEGRPEKILKYPEVYIISDVCCIKLVVNTGENRSMTEKGKISSGINKKSSKLYTHTQKELTYFVCKPPK